jgi:excisionase family DNA binding protein
VADLKNQPVRLHPDDLEAIAERVADAKAHGGALMDAAAIAKLLAVPPSWVLAEARANRLPHIRLGRYVRFDGAEVRSWATSRSLGPRQKGSTEA